MKVVVVLIHCDGLSIKDDTQTLTATVPAPIMHPKLACLPGDYFPYKAKREMDRDKGEWLPIHISLG
jgi:hypothetical protein